MRSWPLTVDHVIPQATWLESAPPDSGLNDPDNLAAACYQCNIIGKRAYTRGVDPLSGAEVELFNPRRERWSDHFAWSQDYLTLKGKTSISGGRQSRSSSSTVRSIVLNAGSCVSQWRRVVGVGHELATSPTALV